MTLKTDKISTKNNNKSGAEKPISLWGASFTEVLAALMKTKPMPKKIKETKNKNLTDKREVS